MNKTVFMNTTERLNKIQYLYFYQFCLIFFMSTSALNKLVRFIDNKNVYSTCPVLFYILLTKFDYLIFLLPSLVLLLVVNKLVRFIDYKNLDSISKRDRLFPPEVLLSNDEVHLPTTYYLKRLLVH